MIKVGLTGSKYSGKKHTVQEFRKLGVKVFDADLAIKYLLNFNIEVIREVQLQMGNKASSNFYITKGYFDSDKKMIVLLKLIEDELFSIWDNYIKKHPNEKYIIFKCSCLYEMGWNKKFDKNIMIFSSHKTNKDRMYYLYKKNNYPIYDLNNEMDMYEKNSKSDIVIHNYDQQNIFKQISDANTKLALNNNDV